MPFIIDRHALIAINRRAAERLRSPDGKITGQDDAEIMTAPAAHFSRDDIRKALMLAKKRNSPSAETMQANDGILGANDDRAAMKKT
jgi:hypothetical protein